MATQFQARSALFVVLAALVVSLAFSAPADAQKKPGKPENPQKKYTEAEALREAYILMAGANADYKGHRHKAMAHVKDALKAVDANILKTGSPLQKELAAADAQMEAAVKAMRGKGPVNVESQKRSDNQMREAHKLVHEVHKMAGGKKHEKLKEHTEHAMKEIDHALKVK
jgi:hypothetical protein